MIRYIIPLALATSIVQARTSLGVGEYRYGPDTTQNIACKFAEERAKENAIEKFSGEDIDITVYEKCNNDVCDIDRDSLNETRGYIKKILSKDVKQVQLQGYTSCIVTIKADVDNPINEIKLSLDKDEYFFKENQEVVFRGVVNRTGNLVIFNLYNNVYSKVYEEKITTNNQQFMLPSPKNRIVTRLPVDKHHSKEVLMFLFTENDYEFRKTYTELEMNYFLKNMPSHQRQIVNRYVYIMRNV
jgi:hypothetical protein